MRRSCFVLRFSRWINPLPSDSGQRFPAKGVEFGRNAFCASNFGDVMNRTGAALAAKEEVTTATHNGRWIQSGFHSGSLLDSTTVTSRAKPSEVGGERAELPLSLISPSYVSCLASGTEIGNSTGSMAEVCQEGSGADESGNWLNGSVVPGSRSLEMELNCGSGGGNGGSSRERGLTNQSRVNDSPESSGQSGTASFLEADRTVVGPSSLGVTSFVGVRNSCWNSSALAENLHAHDPLAQFVPQNSEMHCVAEASLQSQDSELPMLLPVNDGPESREVDTVSKYPVPLTPFSGEVEKAIEYERAMVAETAMKSGPAISRSDILFEDEWLMVMNKPCGIYSEHVLATIPSLLQTTAPLASDSSPRDGNVSIEETHLHMANRLDRDTSGVMVITKCKRAAGKMAKIFTTRWIQKSYLALCAAPPPTWKHLTVESGHGRSRFGAWRVYAKGDVGRELPGKCVVRDMKTHFMVVAVNKELVTEPMDSGVVPSGRSWWEELKAGKDVVVAGEEHINDGLPFLSNLSKNALIEKSPGRDSLPNSGDEVIVRAFPFTGRTHQIRLHCQYVGLSLRGDVKYGGPHIWNGVQYDHHALHAETLSFRHPFTSEELFLVAPLPQWARDAGIQTHQG